MKKILVVLGGGRPKGNTARLVQAFMEGAREAGHETELVSLMKTEVKGCLGCNACRYGKPCIQKDGFNEIAPKILGGRSGGICLTAIFLDHFFTPKGFY